MSDLPEWKKLLQEPNAIGWIGFFLLVVAIGAGTLYFHGTPAAPKGHPAPATHTSQAN